MKNPTTDLAARFEAKRKECEEQAEGGFNLVTRRFWQGRAEAFAEARDMARADAAGVAGEQGEPESVSLAACPIGLFWSNSGELCLKTEYGNNEGRIDAYIVSSGEFFWGDPPQTIGNQRRQSVRPVCWQALSAALTSPPPPPAQRGSPPPPLTAERVDLGELERLSAEATQGAWTAAKLSPEGRRRIAAAGVNPTSGREENVPWTGLASFIVEVDGCDHPCGHANIDFVVALVNAYRSGHLVPASLPGGTGSVEEGTDLGACLTAPGSCPSGEAAEASSSQATAIPSRGWSTIADCPSDGRTIWVFGGRHKKPALRAADGSWWRHEAKTPDFAHTVPTHWMPEFTPESPVALAGEAAQAAETEGLGLRASDGEAGTPTPMPTPIL
jgi:hypothetical protein